MFAIELYRAPVNVHGVCVRQRPSTRWQGTVWRARWERSRDAWRRQDDHEQAERRCCFRELSTTRSRQHTRLRLRARTHARGAVEDAQLGTGAG